MVEAQKRKKKGKEMEERNGKEMETIVGKCQGTSLAVCTPLYTPFTVHISPSFYFAYIHLLLFGYHLNLSCSQ